MNQNLNQFITSARNRPSVIRFRNAWVVEPDFEGLYVRYGTRYITWDDTPKLYNDVLDIANVSVKENLRRKGIFTGLINKIRDTYPDIHIYVENANPDTLQALLLRLGFKEVRHDNIVQHHSFFLPAKDHR